MKSMGFLGDLSALLESPTGVQNCEVRPHSTAMFSKGVGREDAPGRANSIKILRMVPGLQGWAKAAGKSAQPHQISER